MKIISFGAVKLELQGKEEEREYIIQEEVSPLTKEWATLTLAEKDVAARDMLELSVETLRAGIMPKDVCRANVGLDKDTRRLVILDAGEFHERDLSISASEEKRRLEKNFKKFWRELKAYSADIMPQTTKSWRRLLSQCGTQTMRGRVETPAPPTIEQHS